MGINMISKILNFFSTKSVQDKILKGTLSEGQLFIYFYLILMIDTIDFVQQCLSVANKNVMPVDLVHIWGLLIINGIGYIILFVANGGTKGKNFLSKFFSISFTVGFKYGIAFIILSSLPNFLSALVIPRYDIGIFIIVNILMVANMAFRIYEIR